MDAASELRHAPRGAALITGPVMDAAIAPAFRTSQVPCEGAARRATSEMRLARYAARVASATVDFPHLASRSLAPLLADFPRYEACADWLATPAPRP